MKKTHGMLVTSLIACTAFAVPSRAQEIERGWKLLREDLEIFIEDPTSGSLYIEGTLVARLEDDETSPGPILGMNSRAQLMRFEQVSANGAEVELNTTHSELPDALIAWVRFPEPKQRGDEVEVSFSYRSERQGKQFVVGESISLASWVEAWYPILPPQKGVSLSGATKVAGRTTFYLPAGWHAVTNGGLVSSETSDGQTIEVWESDRALSRSFAAGPYTVTHEGVEGLDVSLYLLSEDLPDPRAHVESLRVAIEAMEERWGPYPYPSYAIAEVPYSSGAFGASSEQGFIMVKPNFLHVEGGNLALFAHEASHAWWGNTVGADGPGSILCSESLAQYGAVIAAESVWGKEEAIDFLRFSRPGYVTSQCARGYFELWRAGHDKPLAELKSGGHDHTLSDAKGHWVYHMLRRRIGDEAFFGTLRELIAEYSGRLMTLDDLRAKFIDVAPAEGLEQFFAQWLDQTGAPVLRHEWQDTPTGISLTIEQLQGGDPYDLRLDVGFMAGTAIAGVERVHLHERVQTFELPRPEGVDAVRLDPSHELLLWSPELGPIPVPGLEEWEPDPLPDKELALYTGVFDVAEAGLEVRVTGQNGHLMLALGDDAPEQLVHIREHRFRLADAFVVFDVRANRADGFQYVRDAGGTRRAERRE